MEVYSVHSYCYEVDWDFNVTTYKSVNNIYKVNKNNEFKIVKIFIGDLSTHYKSKKLYEPLYNKLKEINKSYLIDNLYNMYDNKEEDSKIDELKQELATCIVNCLTFDGFLDLMLSSYKKENDIYYDNENNTEQNDDVDIIYEFIFAGPYSVFNITKYVLK
jgi:hypothetical protein